MPTPATAKWPKPKNEDEFEDIATDFLRIRWKDPNATRNGRRGQAQHGVDVVGHPKWLKKPAGGQSKNTDSPTLAMVTAEVDKAKDFPGGLSEFLFVTSGDRDAELQAAVREHYVASPAPFHVEVIFWQDITADLAGHDELVLKHWKGFGGPASISIKVPPPPSWMDRSSVHENETVEYQCELTVWPTDGEGMDVSELAPVVGALARDGKVGLIIQVVTQRQPTVSDEKIKWSFSERQYTNVIRKWEIEVGGHGVVAFRWAEFTTGPLLFLPILSLFDGVILPITLHRLALDKIARPPGGKVRARLAAHGSGAISLNDDARGTIPKHRFGAPEAAADWRVELETGGAESPIDFGIRILNSAFVKFRLAQPPAFLGDTGGAGFLRVDEEVLRKWFGVNGRR
jgi:hypothetical protein